MEESFLRKRSKESTSSSTPRKSVMLVNSQKQSSEVLSLIDFNSETFSSSIRVRPDKVKKTKVRRKKIRSTQDFNQLNNSVTSPDSAASIKSEPKKSKKVKDVYALPKIEKLTEDPFSVKGNKSPDILLNNNVLQSTEKKVEKIVLRKRRKTGNKNKKGISVNSQEDIESNEQKSKKKKSSQMESSEEHSVNSLMYDNSGDSEVEFTYKKKQKKKHDVTKSETKSDKHYIKRIKNMLLNNGALSKDGINQRYDNKSCENIDVSQKRSNKQNIRNIQNTKSISNSLVMPTIKKKEKNSNRRYMNISPHLSVDELTEPGKYIKSRTNGSILRNKSLRSTSLVSLNKIKEANKQGNDFNLCLDFGTLKSQEDISYMSDLVASEGSDDVFDGDQRVVIKGQTGQMVDIKKQPRKSVRFASSTSPKEEINIRRSTFDVDQCSNSLNLFKSTLEKSLLDITQDKNVISKSNYLSIDCDKIGKYETDISNALNDSVVKDNNLNGTFDIGATNQFSNSAKIKSKQCIQSLSSIYDKGLIKDAVDKSPETASLEDKAGSVDADVFQRSSVNITNRQPVIDLTTPTEKDLNPYSSPKLYRQSTFCNDEILIKATKSGHDKNIAAKNILKIIETPIPSMLNKRFTFTNVDITDASQKGLMNVKDEQSVIDLITPSDKKLCNNLDALGKENKPEFDSHKNKIDKPVKVALLPKLNRTATFTKEDRDNVCIKDLPGMNYNSPVLFGSPHNKNIDTSKVTKRRQWNKSQLSTSFLEYSLDIGDTSAPWKGDDTFEKSKANDSIQVLELEMNSKGYKNSARTPPSCTSTPLPVRKGNLLKAVLLKEKNVTIDESKNLSKTYKTAIKPTRTKMPNFALIHQRAYDKMESLKEMSERKAFRAKQLLSGCKPESTSNISSSKSRKFLQFSPIKSKAVPLNTSAKFNESGKKNITNIPNISITKVKNISPLNKSSKFNEIRKNVTNISNISITKVKNITPSKSNPKVVNQEKLTPVEKKKELLKTKSRIPTKVPNNVLSEKQGFTRYGFKVRSKDVKKTTKEEQMKAVANKTKVMKNTVEERRNVIQGVRSNRRFELLMSLRKK